jgi:hypothetical protein
VFVGLVCDSEDPVDSVSLAPTEDTQLEEEAAAEPTKNVDGEDEMMEESQETKLSDAFPDVAEQECNEVNCVDEVEAFLEEEEGDNM